MIKQSFCYPLFRAPGQGVDELCRLAASIGYAGVELWFRDEAFDALLDAAAAHGLTVASMCGHRSLELGMATRGEHDRIEAELRASIEVAARHGIPNLICFSGHGEPEQAEADAIEACAACLRRVAPAAEAAGVNVNMELLNSKVDHAGYRCDHTRFGVAVCERVASARVRLLYDIYHMQIMEGDVIRTMTEQMRWIGHVHTAGNPGRHDLDAEQELNYRAICRAIGKAGYDGFVAHEFSPKADHGEALREAFDVCRGA
ncbi:MAG: TIM barrel protein [Phycisphaeraceae bacterium]